jgi:uncharacterized protein YbjQ (UPF0145 family)
VKTKNLAEQYGFEQGALENYIKQANFPHQLGFTGMTISDGHAIILANNYKQYLSEEAEKQTAEEKAVTDKQAALARMLITSGFNFDGYTITKYSGYISGDDAVSIDRGSEGLFSSPTNVGNALMAALVKIRRNALAELKEAAYALGCNAVIGVDFDYLTLDPETDNGAIFSERRTVYLPYVFGVTANGNAVIIEKNKKNEVE